MEVFDLGKENRFNITGEFEIEMLDHKQNYELVAIPPNKTIKWTTEYSALDTITVHSSKIDLAKNVWLGYNVEILNHTNNDAESQELKMKIAYPGRELSVDGLYLLKVDSFDTDLKGKLVKRKVRDDSESEDEVEEVEEKTVAAKLQWFDYESNTPSKDHQTMKLALKHPSFDRDVTLEGSYYRDGFNVTKLEIDYDYTEDEVHHATFRSEIKNMTDIVGYKNYTISLFALHTASELELIFDGSIGLKPKNYKVESTGSYKRGYLPLVELELISFVDTETREIKIYVSLHHFLLNFSLKIFL